MGSQAHKLPARTRAAVYVCWYWALGRGGIAKTGMLYFYSPLTIGLAVLLLDETVTWPVVAAAVAVFTGVYVSQRD